MRKLTLVLGLMLLLALAACDSGGGGGGGSANTLTLAGSDFAGSTTISISAGQAVTIDDPSASGGIHHLVTGKSGQFTAQAGAPSQFATADGINFNPGDSQTITFPTAGTFTITCTIHPSMLATITVS